LGDMAMRKTLLLGMVVAATFWLNGCVVISCKESGPPKRLYVMCSPSGEVIRMVQAPRAEPRRHSRYVLD
jgi:hypothetical protein